VHTALAYLVEVVSLLVAASFTPQQ